MCWIWRTEGLTSASLPNWLFQEEKALVSGCDGISSFAFLSDTALFLTTFDGLLELWDLQHGCW